MSKKILIIEDDNLLAKVYQRSLRAEGLMSTLADDYNSAIKAFIPSKVSLVVLDVILQNKNGFELLRDFRKKPGGDKVPTIIITGLTTQELNMDKELMVSLNIVGIYTKSQFSIAQFTLVAKHCVSQSEAI